MRRLLRLVAGLWLACQVVAAAAPLMLVSDRFGIDQASCCPGIGLGQVCPMHHKSAADRSTCKMESACAHHDAALLTILVVGVLPPSSLSIVSALAITPMAAGASSTISRSVVPDAPPPQSLLL